MKARYVLSFLAAAFLLTPGALAQEERDWAAFTLQEVAQQRRETGRTYLSFLRVPELHAGLYELAAGSTDRQQPHAEDELYHVTRGRATLEVGGEKIAVEAGSVVYVKAGVAHRFVDITEDLQVLVFFAAN